MQITPTFWQKMDQLLAAWPIVIDRPRGTPHPRYPSFIMPLDYGYLAGTTAADGGGIDVWCGTLPRDRVSGVIVSVDITKMDAELKIMIGCTAAEMTRAWETFATEYQGAVLIPRQG